MVDLSRDQLAAAHHFLAGAAQAGLSAIVLSPGSRSTPLAIAASMVDALPIRVHLDERTAGFAALGEAKASNEPVALICTSGTAAANYAPAVAEANQSHIPLVVITADRPPEHINWGVGQSFVQTELYSGQLRDRILMPVGGDGGLDHAVRVGSRATQTAVRRFGPVAVNWPFRLPVEPPSAQLPTAPRLVTSSHTNHITHDPNAVSQLVEALRSAIAPVIIAGPAVPGTEADAVALAAFAQSHDIPIIADVLSGLRQSSANTPVIQNGPGVLAGGYADDTDLLIRTGDTPTDKRVRLWWEHHQPAQHVLLDPQGRWHDPSHLATMVLSAPLSPLLISVSEEASTLSFSDWSAHLQDSGVAEAEHTDAVLDQTSTWTSAHIARTLGATLAQQPTETAPVVVASSSLPIRDVDTYFPASTSCRVLSNRGINGIDGVVATAIGVTRAVQGRRVVVSIGDVALLHDLGSVFDAIRQHAPLTLVVPNNDGGGIFSMLPIRDAINDETYARLFHTAHGTTFEFLAEVGATYHLVSDQQTLADAIESADDGVVVIESKVDVNERIAAIGTLTTPRTKP